MIYLERTLSVLDNEDKHLQKGAFEIEKNISRFKASY